MVSRLVLGCGGVTRVVLDSLADRQGELTLLDESEARVSALREEGIRAVEADPTDRSALAEHDPDVVFVGVGPDDEARGAAAVSAARAAFPEAHVVAALSAGVSRAVREAVADHADEVVSLGNAISEVAIEAADRPGGIRARRLAAALRSVEGELAVVAHDNPDPDAIASAVALEEIAGAVGTEATPCYYGEISHQENRAMVNLLGLELTNLEPGADLSRFGAFALVDHSRPGVNDQLPEGLPIQVVVDHHPPRGSVEGRFVDLRHGTGATSTLLVGYFDRLGVELPEPVATALLYGIRVDTADFSREVSTEDFVAAARLVPAADLDVLERIENPSVEAETMEVVAAAIRNRRVDGPVLASYVGPIGDRDALAQAADLLLDMEGISTTMVFGRIDDVVYVSARARGTDLDLGEAMRIAFDRIGSAGGHADMAGAQVPLKSIVELADEPEREAAVRESITERFLETVQDRSRTLTGRYLTDAGGNRFSPPTRGPDEG